MKNKKTVIGILICLILLTGICTCIHLSTRDNVSEGSIAVEIDGKTSEVDINSLSLSKVEGTVVNGKGEEKSVSGEGLLLKDLIGSMSDSEFKQATVIADDEYSAQLSLEEINEPEKVYLLVEEGDANLVVFGDPNSKRNVSKVVKLVVE